MEWAFQFFYDVKTDKIHIGVSKKNMHTATHEMSEYQKETGFERYEIAEYERNRFLSAASVDLRIGQQLESDVANKLFLFSGTVIDEKTGMSVAHGFEQEGEKVFVKSAAQFAQEMIGKCRAKIDKIQSVPIKADLAVIDLEPTFNVEKNTVLWPSITGREIRVKMYRDANIPNNKKVMILDQDGTYRYGAIRRYSFSDRSTGESYDNVLAVSSEETKEVAITREGDSGALVTSIPEDNPDVVSVYGIVIALCRNEEKGTSLTIANSLGEVVRNADSLRQQASTQFPDRNPDDIIDFTWLEFKNVEQDSQDVEEMPASPKISHNDPSHQGC